MRDVEPAAVVEEFLVRESPVAVGAVRQTISNMLGTITATPQVRGMLARGASLVAAARASGASGAACAPAPCTGW